MENTNNTSTAEEMPFNDNPGKANYFAGKSDEELEKQLNVYLCMDNAGGKLADDVIEELFRRQDSQHLGTPAK